MSCFNTKIQLFNISFNCIFISTLTWISHGQHLNASKTCTQLFRDTWPNLFFLSLIPCKTDTHPPIYARSFFLCCSGKDSCPLSRAGRVQNSCTCLGKPLTCTHWRLPPAQCSFPTPSPLHPHSTPSTLRWKPLHNPRHVNIRLYRNVIQIIACSAGTNLAAAVDFFARWLLAICLMIFFTHGL